MLDGIGHLVHDVTWKTAPRARLEHPPPHLPVPRLLVEREEIERRNTEHSRLVLHHRAKRGAYTLAPMLWQHEHATEPRCEILAARKIVNSKRGGAERFARFMRHPGYWKLVAIQVGLELCRARLFSILGQDLAVMKQQARHKVSDELWLIGQIVDAHLRPLLVRCRLAWGVSRALQRIGSMPLLAENEWILPSNILTAVPPIHISPSGEPVLVRIHPPRVAKPP